MAQGNAENRFWTEQNVVVTTKYSPDRVRLQLDERIWGADDDQFSSVYANERAAATDMINQIESNKTHFIAFREKPYIDELLRQYEAFDNDPEALKSALLAEEKRKELYGQYDLLDENADYQPLSMILFADHCARFYVPAGDFAFK